MLTITKHFKADFNAFFFPFIGHLTLTTRLINNIPPFYGSDAPDLNEVIEPRHTTLSG